MRSAYIDVILSIRLDYSRLFPIHQDKNESVFLNLFLNLSKYEIFKTFLKTIDKGMEEMYNESANKDKRRR